MKDHLVATRWCRSWTTKGIIEKHMVATRCFSFSAYRPLGGHKVVSILDYQGDYQETFNCHQVFFFSAYKPLGGHKVVLILDYQRDYRETSSGHQVVDHLRKLNEHPIFFNTKKKTIWEFIFHYIIFVFFIFFNIVDHEMNIRFCLMIYV